MSALRGGCLLLVLVVLLALSWRIGEQSVQPQVSQRWPTVLAREAVYLQARWAAALPVGANQGLASAGSGNAVRARRLEVDAVGRARADGAASLYLAARRPDLRALALTLLVEEAASTWPDDHRGRFLLGLAPEVIEAGRHHQVPPSVVLAQAVLESGWGRSTLARECHNLFGVKARPGAKARAFPTFEHLSSGRHQVLAHFRVFDDVSESVQHHVELLAETPRYAHARPLWMDWSAYLRAIAPRYATDPAYVRRVGQLIQRYELDRWDALVVAATSRDQKRS